MHITFATSGLDFNGSYLKDKSLGGSETALAYMAKELAALGNVVNVYCKCSSPGAYDGVQYYPIEQMIHNCANHTCDVLIVSRFGSLWHPSVRGSLKVLWLHDMPAEKKDFMAFASNADEIFMLSDYHIEQYLDRAGYPVGDLVWKTANGVDTDLIDSIQGVKATREVPRFLYSSLPERGLRPLLEKIWPKIHEARPDAELYVAGYDISSIQNLVGSQAASIRQHCDRLIQNLPNVKSVGSLSKSQLYGLMKECTGVLYPCTWPEIFCITAAEAQACGVPIITTNKFALQETVGPDSGVLVDGEGDEYIQNFIDATIKTIDDKEFVANCKQTGPRFVRERGYVWKALAKKWDQHFREVFSEREQKQCKRLASSMYKQGDAVQAEKTIERGGQEPIECEGLLASDLSPVKVLAEEDREVVFDATLKVWSMVASRKLPEAPVILVDSYVSEKIVDFIKAAIPGAIIDTEVKERAGKYHAVISADKLCHSSKPHDFLQDTASLLKPDGVLLILTPYGRLALQEEKDAKQRWSFTNVDFANLAGDGDVQGAFLNMFSGTRGETLGYWVMAFGCDARFEKLDLRERSYRFRPDQTLSTCMIAKDEEQWINMCLHNVKDISDEIIVVDTGSKDSTIELAKRHGCKVIEVPFSDFETVRNVSIDNAKGDFFLWIDCDEKLVNGKFVHKYLQSRIAEAFIIKQNHLSVDVRKHTFDMPARVVRRRPQYRFVGCIHEHCEDISCRPEKFSNPITNIYEMSDVDIAHFGYEHESRRRQKCILRNLDLLIKDAKVNLPKGRNITLTLAIRDYLNAVKWSFKQRGEPKVDPGSLEHILLEAVCDTYHAKFRDSDERSQSVAFTIYQEALNYMAISGLPYSSTGIVPFHVAMQLQGDHTQIDSNLLSNVVPETMRFVAPEEMREFVDIQACALGKSMFNQYNEDRYRWDFRPQQPDPVQLLTRIRSTYKRG